MIKKVVSWLMLMGITQSCFLLGGNDPKPVDMTSFLEPKVFPLDNTQLQEASGIAPSQNFPNFLFTHEDNSSRPNHLHLISPTGGYDSFWELPIQNRDWEDIAVGPGPTSGTSYIYLGNIGDNLEQYSEYEIYRFPEPRQKGGKIQSVETLRFQYSDNRSYDAETLMIDPSSRDLYILTKRQFNVRLYKIPFPQKVDQMNIAQFLFTLPYPFLTGGDISVDGKEILLKNYDAVYYWRLRENETIEQALQRPRDVAPAYVREPQGEAICFDRAQTGFFTLSEIGGQGPVQLYFYPKKVN